MSVEDRLAEHGITLPAAAAPAANYLPFVEAGGHLHISGQIPFAEDGSLMLGRLGETMEVAAGQRAAARCAVGIVAQVKAAVGDFGRVKRFVKLNVFVNSAPGFTQQPEVANGASDLLVALFGEAGRHARSAVGVAVLPRGVAVEVDAVVDIR
jgi:enamine deaminase RidA (YjgF/YER057c/UK114 family)